MNQNLLLKFSRWAFRLLGIGIAANSCDVIGLRCEYGTPTMSYTVQGKVVDSQTGKGIPGIKVSRYSFPEAEGEMTDAQGGFELNGQDFPMDTLHIHISDVDGPQNGSYDKKEAVVNLTQTGEGDGHWYSGKYSATNLVIYLDESKEAE